MTNKEAKAILSNCDEYFHTQEEIEAFKVALEALDQMDATCENLAWYINEKNRLTAWGKASFEDGYKQGYADAKNDFSPKEGEWVDKYCGAKMNVKEVKI